MNEQAAMTAGFIGLIVWTVLRNYVLPWVVERLRQPKAPAPKVQQFSVPVQATAGAFPRLHEPDGGPVADLSHQLHLSIPFVVTITPQKPGL